MKKQIIVILLLFLFKLDAYSQLDSIKRKYLTYTKKNSNVHQFFKENTRLLIISKNGEKKRGKLFILNDSTLLLKNNHLLDGATTDTFSLKDVNKIKYSSPLNKFVSIYLLLNSYACGGIAYLFYEDGTYTGIGNFFTGLSATFLGSSVLNYYGKTLKHSNYQFKVLRTNGFELKKKHLKYLLK